jgi:DNA-binding ferritin-like protein
MTNQELSNKFIKVITLAITFKNFLQLCHWGVRGMFFYQYHTLFGELYDIIGEDIDTLAEQANIRGVFLNSEIFIEPPSLRSSAAPEMVESSLSLLDTYKNSLYELCSEAENSDERGTCNLVEDIITKLEKVQYLLEASLS